MPNPDWDGDGVQGKGQPRGPDGRWIDSYAGIKRMPGVASVDSHKRRGWKFLSDDGSPVGIREARALAKKRGANVYAYDPKQNRNKATSSKTKNAIPTKAVETSKPALLPPNPELLTVEKASVQFWHSDAFEVISDYLRDAPTGLKDTKTKFKIGAWEEGDPKAEEIRHRQVYREFDLTVDEAISHLDSAIKKHRVRKDTNLYRGVDNSDGWFPEKVETGFEFEDSSFVATSGNRSFVSSMFTHAGTIPKSKELPIMFVIEAKQGQRGVRVPEVLGSGDLRIKRESETILPRNSRFRVKREIKQRGYREIVLEIA